MQNRSASEDLTQTASTGTCRQIAVIDVDSSTNIEDAISAVTLPTAPQPSNTTGGNAGNQFGRQARSIGMIKSGSRQTTSTRKVAAITIDDMARHISTVDLDSHADPCTLGANFKVISYTEKECNVTPYHPDYPSIDGIPVVQAATAYTHPETGETVILVVNQGLYMGDMLNSSLLTPNQLRSFGIIVDDCPLHLAPDPSRATHSIYSPHDEFRIPLQLKGVISHFTSRCPTTIELESCVVYLGPQVVIL
jgi:hypothetical protein